MLRVSEDEPVHWSASPCQQASTEVIRRERPEKRKKGLSESLENHTAGVKVEMTSQVFPEGWGGPFVGGSLKKVIR